MDVVTRDVMTSFPGHLVAGAAVLVLGPRWGASLAPLLEPLVTTLLGTVLFRAAQRRRTGAP